MKIHLYQIAILCISSVMLFQGGREFFKRETGQTFLKFVVRLIVWGGMGLIAIYPNSTIIFAKMIGIEGNINAVILTGFLLVFLLIFKLLSAIEKIEQNISELTRKEALSHLPEQLELRDNSDEEL
ncbi:MAG: DUF2304 domain-containing protein [Pseudomonadota bacterium]